MADRAIQAREIDLVAVKGKSEPVQIHELLSIASELSPEWEERRMRFGTGLEAYRTGLAGGGDHFPGAGGEISGSSRARVFGKGENSATEILRGRTGTRSGEWPPSNPTQIIASKREIGGRKLRRC